MNGQYRLLNTDLKYLGDGVWEDNVENVNTKTVHRLRYRRKIYQEAPWMELEFLDTPSEDNMNRLLKEIRKGEEDNVLPFDAIPKPEMKPPDGRDWLRELPFGCRFLATKKGVATPWAESFGIGHILDGGILLATESDYGPGISWKWAISHEFSKRYILLQILPELKEPPEEEGEKDGNSADHTP